MASVQIAGLASGMNWQQIINELVQADSAGMNQVQKQQDQVNSQVTALGQINTDLENLSNSIFALEEPSLYSAVTVSANDASSTWQANATNGTPTGSYAISVSQLATASTLTGATNIAQPLNGSDDVSGLTVANMDTWEPVTAGTFSVNGAQVTVATSESLQDVFNAISTATNGAVAASYDSSTDEVTLSSSSPIVLGAANDTSNFLQALKLANSTSSSDTLTSSGTVGALNTSATLADAGFATALTGQDSSGNGTFTINGVTIDYNVNTDTVSNLIGRINNANAGVTATYDAYDDKVILTNTSTGDLGMGVSDTEGNLAAALGITTGAGATLAQGVNAQYSVNGGPTQSSFSNTLAGAQLGAPGLSVTVDTTGSQTIEVATDTSGIQTAIQSFITAFNQVQTDITDDSQITTGSNGSITTSILSSDNEVEDWANQLQMTAFSAGNALSGAVNSLDALGIDFNGTTGQLEISDQGAMLSALSQNTAQVAAFFQTAQTGFGSIMNSAVTDIESQVASDQNNLQSESTQLGDQITTMQAQLSAQQAQMESEFEAMETFESQYQSELQELNSVGGGSSTSSTATSNAQAAQSSNVYVDGNQVSSTSASDSTTGSSTGSTS